MGEHTNTRETARKILDALEALLDTPLNGQQQGYVIEIHQLAQTLILDPVGESTPSQASPPPLRILLVEDNPFTRKLMERLISTHGHQSDSAENGRVALEKLRANTYDAVFMDLRMPEMDGFETTRAIRLREKTENTPHQIIIAVTSLSGDVDRKHAFSAGVDGYQTKPVQANALFDDVRRLLPAPTIGAPQPKDVAPPPSDAADPLSDISPPPAFALDVPRIMRSMDGDWELLREVVALFFEDAPRQMALIKKHIEMGDASGVREAAHSLKGASGTFGKTPVFETAYILEKMGIDGNLDNAMAMWNTLNQLLDQLHALIHAALETGDPA